MEITCPNCGQTCEVDEEPMQGQHLLCPFCDVKFNYSPQSEDGVNADGIGETTACATCGHESIAEPPSKDEPVATTPGNKRGKAILAKARSAANATKVKTVALWQSSKKGKVVILGIVAFLAICLTVPFLLPFSDDSNAAVPKNSRTNTTSENHAEKIKEAVQALGNYIETPTDRRLQAVYESLEHCPQDFREAVKDLLISLNKTYEDMISKQEQEDAMAGTIFLGLLAGAVSDNPRDAMSSGFQIGHAIHSEMQQKAQKRLEQEIKYKVTNLIDIAQKYGVDLREL